jgi:hypothetical protein
MALDSFWVVSSKSKIYAESYSQLLWKIGECTEKIPNKMLVLELSNEVHFFVNHFKIEVFFIMIYKHKNNHHFHPFIEISHF